jgi:hypothetical protein
VAALLKLKVNSVVLDAEVVWIDLMERLLLDPQASKAAFIDGAAIARSKKRTDV